MFTLKACSVDMASNQFRSLYAQCDTCGQKKIAIYVLKENIIAFSHIQLYKILAKLYDIWNYSPFRHFYHLIFKIKLNKRLKDNFAPRAQTK
jgi:hypothetical protein